MFEPTFTLTPRIQRQLVAIERTRGMLSAVRMRPEWVAELRQTVRVEDALASVQIEGNSLTLEAAFELLDRPGKEELRDSEKEFLNYLGAFDAIEGLRGQRDYTFRAGDLRNIHQLLVEGVRGGDRFAGQIRREDVCVGDVEDGETVVHHQPPSWGRVDEELEDLLTWVDACKAKPTPAQVRRGVVDTWTHPVLVAGIMQHRLVWIHPFVDGNGRTARMFTTALLYQRGYDYKYLFDLASYYNRDRDKYYAKLRSADRTGDYTEWLEYFAGGLSLQMYQVESKAKQAAVESGDSNAGR